MQVRALALAVITTTALGACGVAGCGGGSSNDSSGKPAAFKLAIVDVAPLSGGLAPFGASGRKAADLAVARIKAATARAGADETITVVPVDDKGTPTVGVEAVNEGLATPGVGCIVGSWKADVTSKVALDVTVPKKLLQITPAATDDGLAALPDMGLLDRTVLPDSYQGRGIASVLEEDLGGSEGRTVNIAAEQNGYGKGIADAFTKAWKAVGGRIGQRVDYAPMQKSYAAQAAQVTTGEPDAYVVASFAAAYPSFARALLATGRWDPGKTYVTDALALHDLPQIAGSDATEGLRGTAPGSPVSGASAETFNRLYVLSQPKSVHRQTFDAQTFDAVTLCYLSAVAAGKVDGPAMAKEVRGISGPPGEKLGWEQLPEAVKALAAGRDIDYAGASGPIDLDAAGDPTAGTYDLFRYRNGKIDVYDQVAVGPRPAG